MLMNFRKASISGGELSKTARDEKLADVRVAAATRGEKHGSGAKVGDVIGGNRHAHAVPPFPPNSRSPTILTRMRVDSSAM